MSTVVVFFFYRAASVNHGYSYGKESNEGLETVHVCMNVHNSELIYLSPQHIPLTCLSCDVI